MGKSTISGPFSIAMLNYQRVTFPLCWWRMIVDMAWYGLLPGSRVVHCSDVISHTCTQRSGRKCIGCSNPRECERRQLHVQWQRTFTPDLYMYLDVFGRCSILNSLFFGFHWGYIATLLRHLGSRWGSFRVKWCWRTGTLDEGEGSFGQGETHVRHLFVNLQGRRHIGVPRLRWGTFPLGASHIIPGHFRVLMPVVEGWSGWSSRDRLGWPGWSLDGDGCGVAQSTTNWSRPHFFFFQSYNWDPTHRGLLVPELIFQYNIGQLMGC